MPDNGAMTHRQCGSCTACCEGWVKSETIGMYPGQPCKHCTESGCAIYATRPRNPCRTFVCGWLKTDSPLPEHMRPDKAGVIVLMGSRWRKWKVLKAVATGPNIPADSLEEVKKLAFQSKTPLLITEFVEADEKIVGEIVRGFGPPEFSAAVQQKVQERQGAS